MFLWISLNGFDKFIDFIIFKNVFDKLHFLIIYDNSTDWIVDLLWLAKTRQ